jgi:glyceraldehyde 3-phosphate dehydrogenase
LSTPRIAINGFGRIGRTITRIAKLRGHFNVVAVNDLASPEDLAYAFRYDSIHGIYPGSVTVSGDRMEIDGDPFTVLTASEGRSQAGDPHRALQRPSGCDPGYRRERPCGHA